MNGRSTREFFCHSEPAVYPEPAKGGRRRISGVSFALGRLLLTALRAYQAFLSPLLPAACKFYPSCSNYALEAIERFGVRRGTWLAFQRLLRCRPFSQGGWDPVPHQSASLVRPAAAGSPQLESGQ